MKRLVTIAHALLSLILAFILIVIGAIAADKYSWPLLHAWALAHGTSFLIYPVYFILFYILLRPFARMLRSRLLLKDGETKATRVSSLAIFSLISSGCGFLIPVVFSVLAIVLGHLARQECRRNAALSGKGIALSGLILGYLGMAYSLYIVGVMLCATVMIMKE